MAPTESRYETLSTLRREHVTSGIASATPIFVGKAEGALLWDIDHREYIDFAGGIGTLAVGHSHPRVVEAVRAQLERFTHTAFQVAAYEPYLRVAERLNAIAPGNFPKKTLLVTTGAEAVENAVKIARFYTKRTAIIAFTGAFHGRTLLGMSLTAKERPYRFGFGPMAPEIYHAPYPYEYRGWTVEKSLAALKNLFACEVDPERVAAIIIEPVLGEGGFVPAPPDFLRELRRISDEHGIVLVADEIQTGFGRTARWFATEHAEVIPDLTVVAKSLAGGLPLSGVVGRSEIMDSVPPGGLGGTYAGNPLACAAALAVFDIFQEEGLLSRAQQIGHHLRAGLNNLASSHDAIGDVRGLGPMMAIELVDSKDASPNPRLARFVTEFAHAAGLIVLSAGLYGNVIRFLPPLVATDAQIERAVTILEEALSAAGQLGHMVSTA